MSAEAGGALGALLLLAMAAPIILIAIKILLIGGACAAAVAAAVGVARGVNRLARSSHVKKVRKLIEDQSKRCSAASSGTGLKIKAVKDSSGLSRAVKPVKKGGNRLAERVTKQREQLLSIYEKESAAIESASEELSRQHEALMRRAKQTENFIGAKLADVRQEVRRLNDENSRAAANAVASIRTELDNAAADLERNIVKTLEERRRDFGERLDSIEARAFGDAEGQRYASELWGEAKELFDSLGDEPAAERYVSGRIKALRGMAADYEKLKTSGQTQAMIAAATAFAQQTMETFTALDTERHREQLMRERLELSTASLRARLENGMMLTLERGEQLPHEADYWAEGALAPLAAEAKRLLDAAGGNEKLTAARLEELLHSIAECDHAMESVMIRARQAYANCYMRLQLAQKAEKGFGDCGWKKHSSGFEGGDLRKALILRFKNDAGATADLGIIPRYNTVSMDYDAEVKLDRHDPGVIDEGLRDAQLKQLGTVLRKHGVNVSDLKCNAATRGRNSFKALDPNRFSIPVGRRRI